MQPPEPDKDPQPANGQQPHQPGGDDALPMGGASAGEPQGHGDSAADAGATVAAGGDKTAEGGGVNPPTGVGKARKDPILYDDGGDSFLGDGIGYEVEGYEDEDVIYDDALDEPSYAAADAFGGASAAGGEGGEGGEGGSGSLGVAASGTLSTGSTHPATWNPQRHKTVYIEDIEAGGGNGGNGGNRGDGGDGEDDEDGENSSGFLGMNFWSHVEELRWVIVKSVIAFMLAMFLMMFFSVYAQKLLTWPLAQGMNLIGKGGEPIDLRTDGPFNVFTFLLQLWVFGGLVLSMPFILYFCSSFILPGLTEREKRLLRPVTLGALGLFLVGAVFAFGLLLPTYIAMSLTLEQMFGFASLWTPSNYYGAVVWTTLGLGLVFQFPLVLILLQYMGLVKTGTLRQFRRHAFVIILVIAAALTPGGDPITLTITTAPLYLLFEAALLIGERLSRKLTAAAEPGDDASADDVDVDADEFSAK